MSAKSVAQAVPAAVIQGLIEACEVTALAASAWVGRGDKLAADRGAVDAMRAALASLPMDGRIVIGEGERDEAPMLYVGEELGAGGPGIDIALDPLEGTRLTAEGRQGALVVLAAAPKGQLLHAPDVYMDKLAVGSGLAAAQFDLSAPPDVILREALRVKGGPPEDFGLCVLDRPRHETIIEAARSLGVRVHLIGDGDIAGAFFAAQPETHIDMYLGRGGAPEGVLAAAALSRAGGRFLAKLHFRSDEERERARRAGITDLDRIYTETDLAGPGCLFIAAGVTGGPLLPAVRTTPASVEVHSLVLFPDGRRWHLGSNRPMAGAHA